MHVRVEPYSPAWAAQFKAEAARVARALGDALIEIHHIGSTAVPGFAFLDVCWFVRRSALNFASSRFPGSFQNGPVARMHIASCTRPGVW